MTVLITDSTANLPAPLVEYWGIGVVPVQVIVGDHAYDEGRTIGSGEVAAALRDGVTVSTSRPSPGTFLSAYRAAADAGAERIISAHLSADLSGTYESALLAASDAPVPVRVIDSRSVSMGLGFAVIAAARVLKRGGTDKEAADVLVSTAVRSRVLFYVDSLDFLRRGGRIGAAQKLLGSALAVRPILHVAKGRVQPLEKVRTTARALGRLEELAVEFASAGPSSVAVMHLDAERRAQDVAAHVRQRLPETEVMLGGVGAVIGSHVGPGAVAAIVSPVLPP